MVDSVGFALFLSTGSIRNGTEGHIPALERIAPAAEVGVGTSSGVDIRLVPIEKRSEGMAARVQQRLDAKRWAGIPPETMSIRITL